MFFGLLVSCEENPLPLTTNSTLWGSVYADSSDKEVYGITVVATGPYGMVSFITKNRSFKFEGLGNGTYYLDYSKNGFGTIRQYGFQLFEGETVRAPEITLYKNPSILFMPKFLKAYPVNVTDPPAVNTNINIDLPVTNVTQDHLLPVMIFMSNSKNVAWNNYDFFYPGNDVHFKNYIPYININTRLPFKSGSEVFVRGYPCNPKDYYGYFDHYLGKLQFSTLNKSQPSNVVSFIMP